MAGGGGGGGGGGNPNLKTPYIWTFPDVVNTVVNSTLPRLTKGIAHVVTGLELVIETAPTGATLGVTFHKGDLATGAITGVVGTLSLPIGAYDAVSPVISISIAAGEFLVPSVNQVGSTVAGKTLTMIARAG